MTKVPIYYRIDGVDEVFKSLKDAKYYIWNAYTNNRGIGLEKSPNYILGCNDDKCLTATEIKVNEEGKVSFGKAKKI